MKKLIMPQISFEMHNMMESRERFVSSRTRKPCIHVVGLGGTIASLSHNQTDEFYQHPSIQIDKLIALLPFKKNELTINSQQILQQISHDMTQEELIFVAMKINELANKDEIDGIVVIQGTNCIEETAYFINLVVRTKKPIVFTGSFRPTGALGYDGSRNLFNSIFIASHKEMSEVGVVLSFNDGIVSAREATKINPSVAGDFSVNGLGLLGFVQGTRLCIQHLPTYRHTYQSEFTIDKINELPTVYILYGHLGLDSHLVEVLVASGAKGIISAGMGKGYQSSAVTNALRNASHQGVFVVRCSRSGYGFINRDNKIDDQNDFIAGGSLNPQKARILLSVAMLHTKEKKEIQRIFDQY
ncbi:asparaginase [Legionella feeleii]|nr:asparaginase [Legionella feeleii]